MDMDAPQSLLSSDVLHELKEFARLRPKGDFVEVGVYKGGSAVVLADVAREQNRRLFLFDTFTGIPLHDPQRDYHQIGDFADTSVESVRAAIPDAFIVQGVFPCTLTDEVGPIALAHIDCDQYESVRACCLKLGPRMVSGGVMAFDDYNVLEGARAAVDECFPGRVQTSFHGKARVFF